MELLLNKSLINYYNQDLVAKAGIATLYDVSKHSEEKDLFKKLFDTKTILLENHPDNIVLKNSIDFFLYKLPLPGFKEETKKKYINFLKELENSNKELSRIGARKIRAGSTVFVHSINNHIINILLEASANKKIKVHALEHSPFYFGKILMKKLAKHNIEASLYSDLGMRDAVSDADICLIGGEAILQNKGAVCKKGSYLVSEIAAKYGHRIYVVAHSWKYDSENSILTALDDDKGRQRYDYIPKENISAFISEYGIFKPDFIEEEIRHFNRTLR